MSRQLFFRSILILLSLLILLVWSLFEFDFIEPRTSLIDGMNGEESEVTDIKDTELRDNELSDETLIESTSDTLNIQVSDVSKIEPYNQWNGQAPLFLSTMTHMENNFTDDKNEATFNRNVEKLRFGMELASEYEAVLTIESEEPFSRANEIWGLNFFEEILSKGHFTGTHCDIGGPFQPELNYETYVEELKINKALIDDFVDPTYNQGCSGAGGENNWASGLVEAGFTYINGLVSMHLLALDAEDRPGDKWTDNYLKQGGFHDNFPDEVMDRIYLKKVSSDLNSLDHDPNGSLVMSNGELGQAAGIVENYTGEKAGCRPKCTLTYDDADALASLIREVNTNRDKNQVAKLNVYFPLHQFAEADEDVLTHFFSTMQKLENEGIMQWAGQLEIVYNYLYGPDWENILNSQLQESSST